MARWVKSYNQMRIYKQAATPSSATDDLKVGDIWVDTTTDAEAKICTAVDTDVFATLGDSAHGLVGTATNDNAAAGEVGEIITASRTYANRASLVTATANGLTSISLTAGDWDVTGSIGFETDSTTSVNTILGNSNTSVAALGDAKAFATGYASTGFVKGEVATLFSGNVPMQRYSLSGTTTIYLVAYGAFTVSFLKSWGYIIARRVR